MKVLALGGEGYIGSASVKDLRDNKIEVYTVDKKETADIVMDLKEDFEFSRVLDEFKPDCVINFAASIGGIRYFHNHPADLLIENESILCSVFSALVDHPTPIIQISSSMVFESTTTYPSKEEDVYRIPAPVSSYGFQKLMSEVFATSFKMQYDIPYIIIRPFNAIGPGEWPGDEAHVVPEFVQRSINKEKPFKMLGKGDQIRCFTNVKDIAKGIRLALLKDEWNTDYNIATTETIAMIDLAVAVWNLCGNDIKDFEPLYLPSMKWDVQKRIPDTTKAKQVLGFTPQYSLKDSLIEVIQWMKGIS